MIPVIKKRTRQLAVGFVVILMASAALPATAQTINLDTVAPDGSPSMQPMRHCAKEVENRSEVRLKIKFN